MIDDIEIFAGWWWKYSPGVHEMRALNTPRATRAGYVDNPETFVELARKLDEEGATGVYTTLNPVDPVLMARASNKVRNWVKKGELTSDPNVLELRILLADFDPTRPSGISSTAEELERALAAGRAFFDSLAGPRVFACSGNGTQVPVAIWLPTSDKDIVKRALLKIKAEFAVDGVTVDTGVFNPARISKVFGTWARKGEDLPDRPHRRSEIIEIVEGEVDPNWIHEFVAEPVEERPDAPIEVKGRATDLGALGNLEDFLERNVDHLNLTSTDLEPWTDNDGNPGWRIEIDCISNSDHGRSAYIVQGQGHAHPYAGCHHNSCDWGWADLRAYCAQTEPIDHILIDEADEPDPFPITDPYKRRAPRKKILQPFWYESAYLNLFGPAGSAKSMIVNDAQYRLSKMGVHSFLFETEDAAQEIERLDRMGADLDYIHVVALSELDEWSDFRTKGFVEKIIQTVRPFSPKLIVFNCYADLGPPGKEADSWNSIVRDVTKGIRAIITATHACVAMLDHQEDPNSEFAYGGRMKRRACDASLRVTSTDTGYVDPNAPHHFRIDDMRANSRLVVPKVMTFSVQGPRDGDLVFKWDQRWGETDSGLIVPD